MTWRPWVVMSALLAALIWNVALLAKEDLVAATVQQGPTTATVDALATLKYSPNSRLENLKKMGLPDDLAEAANKRATTWSQSYGERWTKLLKEKNDVATRAFCVQGSKASEPQRYAAMQLLVVDEDGDRHPVDPTSLFDLTVQEWYATSPVKDVFTTLEMGDKRQDDATAMGVAAILLGKEDAAIEGDYPWGQGVMTVWSFDRVLTDFQDRQIRGRLVDYFAMMHLMVEIANAPGGICE